MAAAQQMLTGDNFEINLNSSSDELTRQLDHLYKKLYETNEDLACIKQEHESITHQYQEYIKLKTQLQLTQNQDQNNQHNAFLGKQLCQRKYMVEQILNGKVEHIRKLSLEFSSKLMEIMPLVEVAHSKVLLDELIRWKREQQLQGNGAQSVVDLNKIQEWCEKLAVIVWSCRQQIIETEIVQNKLGLNIPEVQKTLPHLQRKSTQLLSSLITSTFIIEKQPQQVIKTNARITSTVRLLTGGKLNIHRNPPKVSVSIINEEQARVLLSKKKSGDDSSGDIPDNTGIMEFDESAKTLAVHFKNLRLKSIKRAEKKGSDCVMHEKFSLLFQSQFPVGNGELVFQVWTLSLPVVVVVHGSQDPHAWATVTWDNAFAKPGRIPFSVPVQMTWEKVADALRMKFKGCTGCSLSDENLKYLAEKAFGFTANDYRNMIISFSKLCKEVLPQRTFTFWEWFYSLMKLTREYLRELWLGGQILGFVRKKDAEEMLSTCPKGTFLLRFSESELGGITIAWVEEQNEVYMLQPFTSKDFAVRNLPDRISDLPQLAYLYLQIPKDLAFGKYYTPFHGNPPVNGYVKPLLVTHVPGISSVNSLNYSSSSHLCSYALNSTSVATANESISSWMDC